MISNENFEINKQKMFANKVALKVNYIKNQQSHIEFCCLVKFYRFYGKRGDKIKRAPKKVWNKYVVKKKLYYLFF